MTKGGKADKRRMKGTGSLFLRNGIWYAKWRHNGITKMQSTGIRKTDRMDGKNSRRLAEDWIMDKTEPLRLRRREDGIALLIRQLQTGKERMEARIARSAKKPTLGDMEELFRNSARRPDCSEEMLSHYCGVLRRFAAKAGRDVRIDEFDIASAEAYARAISGKMASGTYNKAINALSLAWRVLAGESGNPWAGIPKKRPDVHVRRALSHEETERLLSAATGETRVLVAVCLYTGLRLGDACRLRFEDIRGNAVFVTTSKRNRKVAIPLHPRLSEILADGRGSGYVMPGIAARFFHDRRDTHGISRSIKRLMEKCAIKTSVEVPNGRRRPDAGAHSLRHTFVTRAIEAGIPPHIVQAIVGHSNAATTERYTHLSDGAIIKAFESIS